MSEVHYFNWNILIPGLLWPLKLLSPGQNFVKVSFLSEFPKFMLVGRKYIVTILWKQYYFCIITAKYASVFLAMPELVKGNEVWMCAIFFFQEEHA